MAKEYKHKIVVETELSAPLEADDAVRVVQVLLNRMVAETDAVWLHGGVYADKLKAVGAISRANSPEPEDEDSVQHLSTAEEMLFWTKQIARRLSALERCR